MIQLSGLNSLGKQQEIQVSPLSELDRKTFEQISHDPNQFLTVAELDGAVTGTFQFSYILYITCSLVAQLEAVHVSKDFRSKKIGTAMMNWAIEQARNNGCHRIQLTSNKLRINAHRFYDRLGFKATHEGIKLFL